VTDLLLTHIGGPTMLIQVGGWRLLTDPTFDPPGQKCGVQFPVTGPVRYTMTAKDAVELSGLVRPRAIIPIHYKGWKHFKEGREAIERELERAPQDIRERIRWLPLGVEVGLAAA
jgi:L-ascorbate metabolism protein UlaG (beta-lactamase superfamily)